MLVTRPAQICVAIEDAKPLQDALGIALDGWTQELKRGESTAWEQFAVSAYVMRKVITSAPADARCRWIALRDDTVGVLHSVARACEAAGAAEAGIVRRYADHAAAGTPACESAASLPGEQ